MKEGRAKADEIRRKGLTDIEDSLSRARAEAIREGDLITRNTRAECAAAMNRRVSQEKQKSRIAYLYEKNKVVDSIMKEVEKELAEFCNDDAHYRPFLLKSIVGAMEAASSEKVTVALPEADFLRYGNSKLLEEALSKTQITKTAVLSNAPIKTMGGAVVTSEDGSVKVDSTLEARIQLMRTQLLVEMSKTLFAT